MNKSITLKSREELEKILDSKKLKSQSVYATMFAFIISITVAIFIGVVLNNTVDRRADLVVVVIPPICLAFGSSVFIVTFLSKLSYVGNRILFILSIISVLLFSLLFIVTKNGRRR